MPSADNDAVEQQVLISTQTTSKTVCPRCESKRFRASGRCKSCGLVLDGVRLPPTETRRASADERAWLREPENRARAQEFQEQFARLIGLPRGTPTGWYADPTGRHTSRYYMRGWTLNASDEIAPTPVPPPEHRASFGNAGSLATVSGTVLGGYGHVFSPGSSVLLHFEEDQVRITSLYESVNLPYNDVEGLRIGGPGAVSSGGGFVGGGFGLVGAAEGMAIAGLLNAVTSRTKVVTIVRLTGKDLDLYINHEQLTPDQLEIALSPVFGRLRAVERDRQPIARPGYDNSPVAIAKQLTELADLVQQELLTREEFAALKSELLKHGGAAAPDQDARPPAAD